MAAYSTLAARNGIEDLSNTMTDVIAHHLANEKPGYKDTYYGIYQIEPVEGMWIKATCKQVLD
jgi:hypothetical protein